MGKAEREIGGAMAKEGTEKGQVKKEYIEKDIHTYIRKGHQQDLSRKKYG